MAIKGEDNVTSKRIILEEGTYPATLLSVVDLGIQKQAPYKGKEKPPARMIYVTYELADEFLKGEDGEDLEDKPLVISERFPLFSMKVENAKSTKRYSIIDPEMKYGGDWSKLLGSKLIITLAKGVSSKGNTFNSVTNLSKPRQKDLKSIPDNPVNKSFFFELDEPDLDVFNNLPEWLRDLIKENINYNGSTLQELLEESGESNTKKVSKEDTNEEEEEDLDDEVPF